MVTSTGLEAGYSYGMGTGYLQANGDLKDRLARYSQPLIDTPENFPHYLLVDGSEHYEFVVNVYRHPTSGVIPGYLQTFLKEAQNTPIRGIISQRGFRDPNGNTISRVDLREYLHLWYYGNVIPSPRTTDVVPSLTRITDVVPRLTRILSEGDFQNSIAYGVRTSNQVRLRVFTEYESESNRLLSELNRVGIIGSFIRMLPPILYRDWSSSGQADHVEEVKVD